MTCSTIAFQIARKIACQPDELRYIGDKDVFVLQEKVVDSILKAEREVQAKAAAPKTVNPTQQAVVVKELKNAIGVVVAGGGVPRATQTRCRPARGKKSPAAHFPPADQPLFRVQVMLLLVPWPRDSACSDCGLHG